MSDISKDVNPIFIRFGGMRLYVLLVIGLVFTQSMGQRILNNYSTLNGLNNDKVYGIQFVSTGKLLFHSPSGLGLFDGNEFIHYDTKDGLADNEVLSVFEDNNGTLWLGGYNGKVSTISVNSVNKVDCFIPKSWIRNFVETKNNKIIAFPYNGAPFNISGNNKFLQKSKKTTFLAERFGSQILRIYSDAQKKSEITIKELNSDQTVKLEGNFSEKVFPLDDSTVLLILPNEIESILTLKLFNLRTFSISRTWSIDSENGVPMACFRKGSMLLIGTQNGLTQYEINQDRLTVVKEIFSEVAVSCIKEDFEGAFWVSTLDKGIFRFLIDKSSNCVKTGYSFIAKIFKDAIVVGTKGGITLLTGSKRKVIKFPHVERSSKVLSIDGQSKNSFYCATESMLYYFNGSGLEEINVGLGIKGILIDKGELYIYKFNGLYLFKNEKCYPVIKNRVNKLLITKKHYYFSDNQHFYQKKINSKEPPSVIFKTRIFSLKKEESKIWFGTKNGLNMYDGEKLKTYFKTKKIISFDFADSNKIIAISNNMLYTRDINGIEKTYNPIDIGLYGQLNGVFFNKFNSTILFTSSHGVYEYSQEELTRNIKPIEIPLLSKKTFSYKGRSIDSIEMRGLKWLENDIEVVFNAVTYNNARNVVCRYFLVRNQDTIIQKQIKSKHLQFFDLSEGRYNLYISVSADQINWSQPLKYSFTLEKRFIQTTGFKAIICFLILIPLLIQTYLRVKRKKEKEQLRYECLNSEHKALRAQMNPHFLFNVLNSIQQFYLKNDNTAGHVYLSKFSKLIRKILNNSEYTFIPLFEEIEYLNQYFELDRLRIDKEIKFNIRTEENMNLGNIKIPSLILQPLLENSLWHGFRNKKVGRIDLDISYEKNREEVKVILSDNGVGFLIEKNMQIENLKNTNPRGIQMVLKRIQLINKIEKDTIRIDFYSSLEGTYYKMIIKNK